MPDNDEQNRAYTSINRGRIAAALYPPGSPEQQEYIAKQGEQEAKARTSIVPGRLALSDADIQAKTMADQKAKSLLEK